MGGRSEKSFEESKSRILTQLKQEWASQDTRLPSIEFQYLDFETSDVASLTKILRDCKADAVAHTAGPFQQRTQTSLLRACIEAGLPYVDVCDEPALCEAHKELTDLAKDKGVAAVTAAGIWPGTSALMVAQAIEELESKTLTKDPVDVTMSFFTAGTGNAGATIVSATFLLLCQKAFTIVDGKPNEKEPWTEEKSIDFKGKEGVKTVRLLDNPDVFTLYNSLPHGKIRSLSSRFATAPGIWNQLFGAMKTIIPKNILGNTDLMQGFSLFSLPIIRTVDLLVGATNAMRVDVVSSKNHQNKCTFIVTHDDLEQCVGLATAAFVLELMRTEGGNEIESGVCYPAELPPESRKRILKRVKRDAIVWDMKTTITT